MRWLFLLIFILNSCSNNPEVVKEFILNEALPIERLKNAEILHTENGILKVKLTATTIKRFKNIQPNLVISDGFKIIFYNDLGYETSVLTASNANIDEIKNVMVASDRVVLKSSDSKRLETEKLVWDQKRHKIYTDKKVIITTDKEVVEGEGFESTPDFSKYFISNIQGTFNFENPAD